MPATRKGSRKKENINDEENEADITIRKEVCTRQTKAKAQKKIQEQIADVSGSSFIAEDEKPPDAFDILRQSPMKQTVNFKPLSFWSKKVSELEAKEKKMKKKKYELYEPSDTDDSSASQNSQKCKKPKKKVKPSRKIKKPGFDFKIQNYKKKPETMTAAKRGSVLRERLILDRMNKKMTDKGEKFTFDDVADFGLTSTPGKGDKLNLVGSSTFDFLSPIPASAEWVSQCPTNDISHTSYDSFAEELQQDSYGELNKSFLYVTSEEDSYPNCSIPQCVYHIPLSISCFELRECPNVNLMNYSLPVEYFHLGEDFPNVEDSFPDDATAVNTPNNSFRNITVRRRYNKFLNNSRRKESIKLQEDTVRYGIPKDNPEVAVDTTAFNQSFSNVNVLRRYKSESFPVSEQRQQTHGTGSNQYSSLSVSGDQSRLLSNTGNDSSVFMLSPDTPDTVKSLDCSVCNKPEGDVTCVRVGTNPKCYIKPEKKPEDDPGSPFFRDSFLTTKKVMDDVTLSEDFDFPLPLFESTTCCPTPVRGGDKTKPEETVHVSNMSCRLMPGKKWARSALILRQSLNGTLALNQATKKGKLYQTFVDEVLTMQPGIRDQTAFPGISWVTEQMSHLSLTRRSICHRTVIIKEEENDDEETDFSFRSVFKNSNENFGSTVIDVTSDGRHEVSAREKYQLSARDYVLMRCNQEAPLPFKEYFNKKTLKNAKKIGEGVFGEVFMCNSNRVIKIIPIEGDVEVNGEPQKKFDEILSEIVIAMELSNLRTSPKHRTNGFCELKRTWCVQGEYPPYLIDLWNDFDSVGRGSENDSPTIFKEDQLYIILEFQNGGKDLESFVFSSAEQSVSILHQMTYSLAVAEKVLEFEHRDLHWGNILIAPTKQKYFKVVLNDEEIKIPTNGVKVTIIDYTLSRITYDGCVVFNDLSFDPTLFTSEGDYQFEIYRLMKKEVSNDWSLYRPKTNLYWIHYVTDKMLKMVRYKKTSTKIHNLNLDKIADIKSRVLQYENSEKFALNCDF